MGRALFVGLLIGALAPAAVKGQDSGAQRRVVIGADSNLVGGANAIRGGDFDRGIELTQLGLENASLNVLDRAAGLANLCAAHVAKGEPDMALPFCDQSLALNSRNWRAYSNRSHAYFLKGMYAEARFDNDSARAISPNAPHVRMIQQMINELTLQPRITVEEHR